MDDIVVENSLSADGIRRLHVMGNQPPIDGWLDYLPDDVKGDIKRTCEAGTHHLFVQWRAREIVDAGAVYGVPGKFKVMLWALNQGKVGGQIVRAAQAYALATGMDPQWAFVRTLPDGAEEFVEVQIPNTTCRVMIVLAEWCPDGFIAIR